MNKNNKSKSLKIFTQKKAKQEPVGSYYRPTEHTYRTNICPKGYGVLRKLQTQPEIMRMISGELKKGYNRKSYTTKKGTKIPKTHVGMTCIKEHGLPGKVLDESKVITISNKNKLSNYGYSIKKNINVRNKALLEAIKEYGYLSVLKKLVALRTLTRVSNSEQSQIHDIDIKKLQIYRKTNSESGKNIKMKGGEDITKKYIYKCNPGDLNFKINRQNTDELELELKLKYILSKNGEMFLLELKSTTNKDKAVKLKIIAFPIFEDETSSATLPLHSKNEQLYQDLENMKNNTQRSFENKKKIIGVLIIYCIPTKDDIIIKRYDETGAISLKWSQYYIPSTYSWWSSWFSLGKFLSQDFFDRIVLPKPNAKIAPPVVINNKIPLTVAINKIHSN